jgi:serine/threonine-protein kinase
VEQATGMHEVGGRSDQYPLGLLLFELVTRNKAVDAPTAEKMLIMARPGEKEPVAPVTGRSIHPDLAAIIHTAIATEVPERYKRIEGFADDIRRFLHGEESGARPDNLFRATSRWTGAPHHPGRGARH